MLKWKLTFFMAVAIFTYCGLVSALTLAGKITGTVVSGDGAAIPGVSVGITGINLVGKKMSVTGESGTYSLAGLPTGYYNVTFSLEGYNTTKRTDVKVDLGITVNLDVVMEAGATR